MPDITKERVSINYLFFGFPNEQLFLLGPLLSGLVAYYLSTRNFEVITRLNYLEELIENQDSLIELYIFWFKLTTVILFAFLISYKWAAIQRNRTYGFWVANGVSRIKFLGLIFLKTIVLITLSAIFGLLILNYPNGFVKQINFGLILLALQLSSIFVWLSIAFFVGEVVDAPEFASAAVLSLFLINFVFNVK
ncbi:MAG: hypothetical protein ACW99A_15800, partial [Candidatus Kariarchaeaceae archaeon]